MGGLDYWKENAPKLRRFYVPNAVPLEQIDAAPPVHDSGTGLFVGRLVDLKNVDILIDAAQTSQVRLTICGDGPEREKLESMAGKGVQFAGYSSDVWSRMKSASFLALLSNHEGRPNVVIEAFAAGVPVVLSDIPAHREIADETCAWFAPVRDRAATADAIRSILHGGDEVQAKVREARRRVEACSTSSMADAYLEVYQEVLHGNKRI